MNTFEISPDTYIPRGANRLITARVPGLADNDCRYVHSVRDGYRVAAYGHPATAPDRTFATIAEAFAFAQSLATA